jgi:hypothetical protein
MKDKKYQLSVEIISTIILGILVIVTITTQILTKEPTKLEVGLFSIIQFILSIGFSWLLSRIVTKSEYEDSLKRYAFSAYRRIKDIDNTLERLVTEINRMRQTYPKDQLHELDTLRLITENMEITVSSSITDWTDIIGDEISKKEELDKTEKEKFLIENKQNFLIGNSQTNVKLEELSLKIEGLKQELPSVLKYNEESYPRAGKYLPIVAQHYITNIKTDSRVVLWFNNFNNFTEEDVQRIKNYKPHFSVQRGMSKERIWLEDNTGQLIGEINNIFDESGVYDNDYTVTLLELLNHAIDWITPGKGEEKFIIAGAELAGLTKDKNCLIIQIPITINELAKG